MYYAIFYNENNKRYQTSSGAVPAAIRFQLLDRPIDTVPYGFKTEKEAKERLEAILHLMYPGRWEYDGQYKFKDWVAGGSVAGYVNDIPHEDLQKRLEKSREARLKEKCETGCSLYGAAGDRGIIKDAYILLPLLDKFADNDDELWDAFIEAGGSDGHSGGSWYGVRQSAVNIKAGFHPMGKDVKDGEYAYLQDIIEANS